MADIRVISADSHMTEPGDLWVKRLDRKFRDNAPQVVKKEALTGAVLGAPYVFVGPGFHPLTVAGVFAAGRSGEELRDHMKHGYEAARPSGWDPVERLKDQDLDGVSAEVLYASLGIALLSMTDTELQQACLRVYNDWLAEFCSHSPKRLAGIGLYSLRSLPDVAEIERCASKDLKGIMPSPADLQIHCIHVVEQCITRLVYGGVFARFPRLKIVSAENDVGWFPNWVHRLDHVYSKMGNPRPRLPLKPSEYVKHNVWATFQDDPLGPATWKFFGEDNYMWASDFPHADSTFPNSVKTIGENFAGTPEEVTGKIVFGNANKLYRLGLD
jgi:predicted TIM-barrel fold metal-dependent hydrolase